MYKIIYNILVNHQKFPLPPAEKRLIENDVIFEETRLDYPCFKIKVDNILYTNKILYKMKRSRNPIDLIATTLIRNQSISLWNVHAIAK